MLFAGGGGSGRSSSVFSRNCVGYVENTGGGGGKSSSLSESLLSDII